MFYKGKNIDPIKLWSDYTEIKTEEGGDFLPLSFCPNPNHLNSHSPAFQINVKKPLVHCFSGCGVSGTYAHAVAVIEGIYEKNGATENDIMVARTRKHHNESFDIRKSRAKVYRSQKEAQIIIFKKSAVLSSQMRLSTGTIKARRAKIFTSSNSVRELKEEDLADYTYLPKEAMAYLDRRGIDTPSRSRWQIGFDEEAKRITIPVRDTHDRIQFIIRRAIYSSQRPVYLYPIDSLKSSLLFGARQADRKLIGSKGLIVVEGSIDCIRLHQHGFRNTVALLGSSISRKQIEELSKLRPKLVYLFLDRDEAGVRGIEKAISVLHTKYSLKIPLYPRQDGPLDPASLTGEQVEKSIISAIPALQLKKKLSKAKSSSLIPRGVR